MNEPPIEAEASFFQDPPELGNQYLDDPLLRSLLARLLPREVHEEMEPRLRSLGERVAGKIAAMGEDAEANPPRHVPYDPWGRRVDDIETSRGWRRLRDLSAEEGLVAIGYERPYGAVSRLCQHALLYLFSPSSAIYLCPLAMTDGAARLIEVHGDAYLRERVLPRLTSRDPERFWTSGQWMTERAGGSDVGRTETVAVRDDDGWRLHGSKWFTSAIEADVAFTLARPLDPDGQETNASAGSGSRGLALFFVELRDDDGRLRGIRVNRLKEKLGTRALPTAELTLDGTPAHLVAPAGEGVRTIATLMNVTRLHNATAAVALMRRTTALARDYARRRVVFGQPLSEQPLHLETLAGLETELAAALPLVFASVELQGRGECGDGDRDQDAHLLRLLTPLVKLFTAKQAVAVASEGLECFGGAGYVEDTGLPRLLRDAQVLPIWEGTTNVLALDALRVLEAPAGASALFDELQRRLEGSDLPPLAAATEAVRRGLGRLTARLEDLRERDVDIQQANARRLALDLTRTVAAALLVEQAAWSVTSDDPAAGLWIEALRRWTLADHPPTERERLVETRRLALEELERESITEDADSASSSPRREATRG